MLQLGRETRKKAAYNGNLAREVQTRRGGWATVELLGSGETLKWRKGWWTVGSLFSSFPCWKELIIFCEIDDLMALAVSSRSNKRETLEGCEGMILDLDLHAWGTVMSVARAVSFVSAVRARLRSLRATVGTCDTVFLRQLLKHCSFMGHSHCPSLWLRRHAKSFTVFQDLQLEQPLQQSELIDVDDLIHTDTNENFDGAATEKKVARHLCKLVGVAVSEADPLPPPLASMLRKRCRDVVAVRLDASVFAAIGGASFPNMKELELSMGAGCGDARDLKILRRGPIARVREGDRVMHPEVIACRDALTREIARVPQLEKLGVHGHFQLRIVSQTLRTVECTYHNGKCVVMDLSGAPRVTKILLDRLHSYFPGILNPPSECQLLVEGEPFDTAQLVRGEHYGERSVDEMVDIFRNTIADEGQLQRVRLGANSIPHVTAESVQTYLARGVENFLHDSKEGSVVDD
uniref:Uncharacterized protein n=1 Tax=Chromera velia CCMP2878 TaxID=1169474 RepID=A0A0G4I8C3_9ALVE|eukprot:Cvel_11909.t1-p1 / transcript=Cvel_11909.t1 / gene=Cvel_11909 / organism=Chromera_velia_CCMP2878 / gene_product=hypothetical protein / transcript_product=hypothetical protein / location=Cvel_scaffold762:49482-50864(-) / protein_length=461 / sequence_SO=supercontig / SO=protein_coding / is_pseudo=false